MGCSSDLFRRFHPVQLAGLFPVVGLGDSATAACSPPLLRADSRQIPTEYISSRGDTPSAKAHPPCWRHLSGNRREPDRPPGLSVFASPRDFPPGRSAYRMDSARSRYLAALECRVPKSLAARGLAREAARPQDSVQTDRGPGQGLDRTAAAERSGQLAQDLEFARSLKNSLTRFRSPPRSHSNW